MRLLLVEPDNQVAVALSAVLARRGFEVTRARSGEEALDALIPDGAGFDLVLLRVVLLAPVLFVTATAGCGRRLAVVTLIGALRI